MTRSLFWAGGVKQKRAWTAGTMIAIWRISNCCGSTPYWWCGCRVLRCHITLCSCSLGHDPGASCETPQGAQMYYPVVLSLFTPFNAAPPRICMICGCCRARYSMTRGLRRRQPVGSSAPHTLAASLAAHTPANRRWGRSREDRLGRKSQVHYFTISS